MPGLGRAAERLDSPGRLRKGDAMRCGLFYGVTISDLCTLACPFDPCVGLSLYPARSLPFTTPLAAPPFNLSLPLSSLLVA